MIYMSLLDYILYERVLNENIYRTLFKIEI